MGSFAGLSSFYDLDYPDTADHAFLRRLAAAADPGHLLEIPCGSGRNVVPLLQASSRLVTFMDIAGEMAAEAGLRIPAAERTRAQAIPGDITSLPPGGEFDLVICPREAFQLLSQAEAARALRSLAAAITGAGLIVLDLFTFTRRPRRRTLRRTTSPRWSTTGYRTGPGPPPATASRSPAAGASASRPAVSTSRCGTRCGYPASRSPGG